MNGMIYLPMGRLTGLSVVAALWAVLGAAGCRGDAEESGGEGGPDDNGGPGDTATGTSMDGPLVQGCASLLQKYLDCNVVYEGMLNCKPSKGTVDECKLQCRLNAECADLKTDLCEDALSASTAACLAACDDGIFICDNGQQIDIMAECNIHKDCNDGSDETHCDEFQCKDGQQSIYIRYTCDGTNDCNDHSDEDNETCPKFDCRGDGSELIDSYRQCDMIVDCSNRADETAECAQPKCAG
jgi:hypothetical protein